MASGELCETFGCCQQAAAERCDPPSTTKNNNNKTKNATDGRKRRRRRRRGREEGKKWTWIHFLTLYLVFISPLLPRRRFFFLADCSSAVVCVGWLRFLVLFSPISSCLVFALYFFLFSSSSRCYVVDPRSLKPCREPAHRKLRLWDKNENLRSVSYSFWLARLCRRRRQYSEEQQQQQRLSCLRSETIFFSCADGFCCIRYTQAITRTTDDDEKAKYAARVNF